MHRSATAMLLILVAAVFIQPQAAAAGGIKLFKMGKAQEQEVAEKMLAEFKREPGLITKGRHYDQLQRVGKRLVESNKLDEYEYRFFLVKDDSVNAFATPGGYIYVHQGLAELMGYDDSMLAAVVAHELGHAKDRHVSKGYEKVMAGGTALGLLSAVLGNKSRKSELITNLVASAGSLMYLKYNRDQEEWADRAGVTLAHGAGYDAYGMTRSLECLQELYGSSGKVENYFENHPPNASRIARTLRIAMETSGKAHGYMKVPQPPHKDHPLWKLYGPEGSRRKELARQDAVVSKDPPSMVTKQSSPVTHDAQE